ncbi:hypothetical protein [Aneurinibacillus tyrosinisolvens]|uniref:hypothetical protein n=1 Tax=Aneurinibacillus tyrosinisolvens TaxID=1443435 RepID=UPI00063EE10D|nr:hypothetical protein [Aneurinibacillus tyrosinisolvens]
MEERRNFLKQALLWVLAFFFGYTVKKEGEVVTLTPLNKTDARMVIDKDGKSVSEKIRNLSNHDSISPDVYHGTDAEKVQMAIDDAITLNRAVKLDRIYDVGNSTLIINNPDNVFTRKPIYFLGVNGGGFKKNVSGFMFTANTDNNGDMVFSNVHFKSIAGAGTKIFNCDKLIRFRTQNCFYKNVDTILYTSDNDKFVQSVRMNQDSIVGGKGFVVDIAGSYDMHLTQLLVETRESFFNHRNTGLHKPLTGSSVKNCVIEGLTGKTMVLGSTRLFDVSNNYLEYNNETIEFLANAAIVGFTIKNNVYLGESTTSALIKWNGDVFGAISENNVTGGIPTHDTTLVISGHIFSTNDRYNNVLGNNIDPDNKLVIASAGSYKAYTAPLNGYITNLGLFKRKTSYVSNITILANNYHLADVMFPDGIKIDDLISVQAFPANLNSRFIVSGYIRGTNKVTVRLKNEESTDITIANLIVTVLQPYISITG